MHAHWSCVKSVLSICTALYENHQITYILRLAYNFFRPKTIQKHVRMQARRKIGGTIFVPIIFSQLPQGRKQLPKAAGWASSNATLRRSLVVPSILPKSGWATRHLRPCTLNLFNQGRGRLCPNQHLDRFTRPGM